MLKNFAFLFYIRDLKYVKNVGTYIKIFFQGWKGQLQGDSIEGGGWGGGQQPARGAPAYTNLS